MLSLRLLSRLFLVFGLPCVALAVALVIAVWERPGAEGLVSLPIGFTIALIGVAWVIGMIWWLSRRITRTVQQMRASAEAIVQGDFSRRIFADGSLEFGATASAFNNMRETLARRLAELQENRHRMETVLSGMVEGVLAVDRQQRVLLANDACHAMLGIPTREVVGRPLLEVVRNLDVQQTVLKALQNHAAASREVPLTIGSRRVIQILATRLAGNPCPGVVVVLHDVTDLRRLEGLRRDFVANVSHELKTPLSAIKAYAETLRLGALHDSEANVMFVERIEEQATRLHRLIVDLLHLARVETGKEAFEFSNVSIREMLEACLSQHADIATAAGLILTIEEHEEDAIVWADPDGIRLILDNLVANAIKFTPSPGSVTLRWRVNQNQVVLEVCDTGIGIARMDQQRVFERFYRADKARSRDLGGTGLGLAIVKHLAQAFGGDVGLSSELGKGSTFRVHLPLATS